MRLLNIKANTQLSPEFRWSIPLFIGDECFRHWRTAFSSDECFIEMRTWERWRKVLFGKVLEEIFVTRKIFVKRNIFGPRNIFVINKIFVVHFLHKNIFVTRNVFVTRNIFVWSFAGSIVPSNVSSRITRIFSGGRRRAFLGRGKSSKTIMTLIKRNDSSKFPTPFKSWGY